MTNDFTIANALSSKEGRAYAKIDGQNILMFYLRDLEATIEKKKVMATPLGTRGEQHRTMNWNGKGKMKVYLMTNAFRKTVQTYMNTGVDTYFDLVCVNDDPQNDQVTGSQTAVLRRVNIDAVTVSKLGDKDELLDEDIPFTFEGVDYLSTFKQ